MSTTLRTEHIAAYLEDMALPPAFQHLHGLALDELDRAMELLDAETLHNLRQWAESYRGTCTLRRMGNISNVLSKILQSETEDQPNIDLLFSEEAIEADYTPEVWKIRARFLADLDAEGGNTCQSCARGVLVRKYTREVEELLNTNKES